jgi:sugar transferase EpsL
MSSFSYRHLGKRILDLAGALGALALLSPLLLAAALLVRLQLGSPVLFRQARAGLRGAPFTLVKFRTMKEGRDADGLLLPDEMRLTTLGRWLRHTSIDELPQLWNVLTGDMSLVGPRPWLPEYLDRYTAAQNRRHDVLPGITGLAQVRGRNALPFSERLRCDLEYVDTLSFFVDCRILATTAYLVAFGKLFDGAGQQVSAVDDIGLHPDTARAGRGDVR